VSAGASSSATVGIGLPSYNGSAYVEEAIESLRAQTYSHFVLACSDDASTDGAPEILARYAREDERILVRRSPTRLGLVKNWLSAFRLAREASPSMRYFAWASDHDVWHPRWLEHLVAELEDHPEAVLAYPLDIGIDAAGEKFREPWRFQTAGIPFLGPRFVTATWGMKAGNMVYGLYRVDALERCGVFRPVIVPDRLLLTELAIIGEFRQVDEVLWSRRYPGRKMPIRARQRQTFFPDGPPPYANLPWPLVHGAVLAWSVGVKGSTRPEVGRARALLLVLWYTAQMGRVAAKRRLRKQIPALKRRLATAMRRLAGKRTASR
jgi:glycosyltransferase involved in cell wall biosynthesis